MNIAGPVRAGSVPMDSSRLLLEVSVAVLEKGLDVAEVQGEAIQEMLDSVVTEERLLDTYA
ncbi:MAG: hypothetical protein HFI93_00260 [Lachnospiraceae bacterium]|nr:hypothetical protein [Lachnospiraceae bacterium]